MMTKAFLTVAGTLFLALAAASSFATASEVAFVDEETSVIRLASGAAGNRTGFRVRNSDSRDGEFTSVLLGGLCEVDADAQRVSGRCLKDTSDSEEREWVRSNTTKDGVLTRVATLTIPLKAEVPSCVEGGELMSTEADASVILTVFTVLENSVSVSLGDEGIELTPNSVGFQVSFTEWPFCSEEHSLQFSLKVGEETQDGRGRVDATGRTGKVRDLDDVRTELNETERIFSDSVRDGAETVRNSLVTNNRTRGRVCSDEAGEQLESRPVANTRNSGKSNHTISSCRSESAEMALIIRELACASEELGRQQTDEAISCHAPGGPANDGGRTGIASDLQINGGRADAGAGAADGNARERRGGNGRKSSRCSGSSAGGCNGRGDGSQKRYGNIPGVGKPPKMGNGKLAIIPVEEGQDINFLLMDTAIADGMPAAVQSSISERNSKTIIMMTFPYFDDGLTYEAVSALTVADAAVGQDTAAIASLIASDARAAETDIADMMEAMAEAEGSTPGVAPWVIGVCAGCGLAVIVAAVALGTRVMKRRKGERLESVFEDSGTKSTSVPMTVRDTSAPEVSILADSAENV